MEKMRLCCRAHNADCIGLVKEFISSDLQEVEVVNLNGKAESAKASISRYLKINNIKDVTVKRENYRVYLFKERIENEVN